LGIVESAVEDGRMFANFAYLDFRVGLSRSFRVVKFSICDDNPHLTQQIGAKRLLALVPLHAEPRDCVDDHRQN
jgi:hypothetical protein